MTGMTLYRTCGIGCKSIWTLVIVSFFVCLTISYLSERFHLQKSVLLDEITSANQSRSKIRSSLRLVTYNLWCDHFKPHTLIHVKERIEGLVDGIQDFDVVLIQEAYILNAGVKVFKGCATQLVQLMEEHGFLFRTSIKHFIPNVLGKSGGVAIFSRVPIIRSHYEFYRDYSWRDVSGYRGFASVEISLNGNPLFVFNTHLDPFQPEVRRSQAKQLAAAIRRLPMPSQLVVGGDFNIDSSAPGPSVSTNSREYVDLIDTMARADLRSVFKGRKATNTDGGHYDMIFVSRNIAVKNKTMLQLYTKHGRLVSDHFGLAVELRGVD